MIAIWYDEDPDEIFITGEDRSYARRSLVASAEADGMIGVRLKFAPASDLKVMAHFTNLADGDGNGFASQAAAKAYLDVVFSRRREASLILQEGTAAVALGGHRVVACRADGIVYASSADLDTVDAILGVTIAAVEAGSVPQVVPSGPIREPSWSWDPGPVYLGLDGLLTQVAPARGAVVQIGIASSPTSVFVSLQEPFHLAA